jgi:hypothetical protein
MWPHLKFTPSHPPHPHPPPPFYTLSSPRPILASTPQIHDFYKDIQTEGSQDNVDGVHEHGGVTKTFHFVAYALNEDGALVEFDGTKQGPWVVATKEEVDACGGMLNSFGKEMQRRLADGEIDPDAMSAMALGPAPAW